MTSDRDTHGGHERYEVISTIAAGGMGSVFLARRLGVAGFRRLVALKRVEHGDGMEELAERLADEARIAAHLAHPNIVAVYDFGQDEHGFFLAMEYVDGASLATVLESGVTPTRDVAAYIIAELARGVDHAHHARDADGKPLDIVHRDISPQNVLLSRTGDVKLTDFGIARAANKLSRTPTGMAPGKLDYMAPEQLMLQPLDGRADVFALGVMLWELTLGRAAFADAITRKARDQPIPRPRAVDPAVPEQLDQIIARATAFRVGDRTPSAAQLAAELDGYLDVSGARIARGHVAALVARTDPNEAATAQTAIPIQRTTDTQPPLRALHVGSQLGAYELTRRLGDGGMGVVYAAVDRQIGKQAAIKVLRPQFAADPETIGRFLDEARAVNKIAHPNIVDIFGFHTDDGEVYCVMELLAGRTLREILVARGALPPAEVVAILRPVASAIDAAHRAHIVHCDLKPENIFVCDGDRKVKVLDFGIAHLHGEPGAADSVVPLGTPAFMAPEQCQGERSDPRIDVYAFGLVAYNALTNAMPFTGAGAIAQIADHLNSDPMPPSQRGAPAVFDAPVLRCLAKQPAARFESAGAAFAALEAAARPPARRRSWPIVVAIAGFVTALAIAFVVVRSGGSRDASVASVEASTPAADASVVASTDASVVATALIDALLAGEPQPQDAAVASVVDASLPDDARRLARPVVGRQPPKSPKGFGWRVTVTQATGYRDRAALQRVLATKQAVFVSCLVGHDNVESILIGFHVKPATGQPLASSDPIVKPASADPHNVVVPCLAMTVKSVSFGPADKEFDAPSTTVIVAFDRVP